MVRLLWRFLVLVAAALGFAWLADRPGAITIQWLGREIHVSVLVASVFLVAGIAVSLFIFSMLRKIWRSPTTAREYLRFRKTRKAYDALSLGIIAAGAGDAQAAQRHAAQAGETLKQEPLVKLLQAQAAQLRGDKAQVKAVFESMAQAGDTELFGLRGLFSQARDAGDWVSARKHAEAAYAKNARLPWASVAVLQSLLAQKDWLGAARNVAQQGKSSLMTRAEATRKQAALLTMHARAIEDSDKANALEIALQAHELDPSLVPAAAIAARIHAANGSARKAIKVLRTTWSNWPHPELASVMARLHNDDVETQFERVRELVGKEPTQLEGRFALARAGVDAKRYDAARVVLEPLLEDRPQARMCGLMAEIEDAGGDKGKSREWLAQALNAPRDPIWVSDGVASPSWTAISPVTGEIVPAEWKPPFDQPMMGQIQFQAQAALPPAEAITATVQPRPPDDPGIE